MVDTSDYYCLIADDDKEHNQQLISLAEQAGLSTIVAESHSVVKQSLENNQQLVFAFIDLNLIGEQKISLLQHPGLLDAEIALIHKQDDHACANQAVRAGATYFFAKPVNKEFIGDLLRDLVEQLASENRSAQASPEVSSLDQFGLLRGSSRPMYKLYRSMRKVAATDASVLLIGESGTGKELAAQTLHELSERSEKPFIAVNCGAIPPDLAESELFGHEKGSFSGADKQHSGYFEQADAGTLFLDELGEMPLDTQVKLLRVLETKKFRRVGSEKAIPYNVRIIAATNREPETAIKLNRLRKDLYFRLAQFPLRMPPLRDRGDDIVGLAQYFLNELNKSNGTEKNFSEELLDFMAHYPWPGNVRELRSATERAYIMAGETIDKDHFPNENIEFDLDQDYLRVSVGSSLEDTEKQLIFATLESSGGDKKKTAEQLGVSLKTLYNKLNSYDEPGLQ